MWWDERSVALVEPNAEIASASSSTAAAASNDVDVDGTRDVEDGDQRLLATVDLEDPYLRDLVLGAFSQNKKRSELWRAVRADGVRDEREEGEARTAARNNNGDEEEEAGSSSSSSSSLEEEEEEEEEEDSIFFPLAAHPLVSQSRFHWGEYERIPWDRVSSEEAMASSYAVRKGLTRKAQLAFGVKKWVSKRRESPLAASFPETHVLQVDDVEYIDEALCDLPEVRDAAPGDRTKWIVKPSVTNRAAGVAVVDGVAGLRKALEAIPEMREWVVQRYVDDPLLLPRRTRRRRRRRRRERGVGGEEGGREEGGGERAIGDDDDDNHRHRSSPSPSAALSPRKWHVRAYALCVGALSVYSFEDGMLALCARKGYEGAPIDDLDAHLTNTCRRREVEKKSDENGDDENETDDENDDDETANDDDDDDDDRILLLSEIPELLSQAPSDSSSSSSSSSPSSSSPLSLAEATERTRRLATRISELIGETFAAVSSELTFFALPSAFELFGFDFLVDERWNPWLLEANADPDVGASGGRLRGVIAELVEGALRLTADEIAKREKVGVRVENENDDDDNEDEGGDGLRCPRRRWKLVYRADAGRQGAGFRVG